MLFCLHCLSTPPPPDCWTVLLHIGVSSTPRASEHFIFISDGGLCALADPLHFNVVQSGMVVEVEQAVRISGSTTTNQLKEQQQQRRHALIMVVHGSCHSRWIQKFIITVVDVSFVQRTTSHKERTIR